MLYRINRFSIEQTSRVAAIVYFGIGILLIPFFLFGMLGDPKGPGASSVSPVLLLFLPIVYGIIGYLTTAAVLFIYNVVARHAGGIELDIVYAVEPPIEVQEAQTSAISSVIPSDPKLH